MHKKKPRLNIFEVKLIEKLKNLRIEQNLTQAELAKKAGLSRVSVTELETFRKKPTSKIIEKISNALDFPDYVKELKKIVEKQNEEFEEKSSNLIENRFNPIPLSDKLISDKEDLLKLKKNTEGQFVFVPGKMAVVISKINGIYAYKMHDPSMEPTIKEGDFLIIKYLKQTLMPDDLLASMYFADSSIVVISNGKESFVRRMKKIRYYTRFNAKGKGNNKTDKNYPKDIVFFIADNPFDNGFYIEPEWDINNRAVTDETYLEIDTRTFSIDDNSDFKIIGVVIMIVKGNPINDMDIEALLMTKWINE
ncbi:MAG: helix-turn-helix domain-containing protein [Deltaproteobacteria bacterium]|nr:helix-turn-helix domain-containing protein [Deltaproteobacteria bacterium]